MSAEISKKGNVAEMFSGNNIVPWHGLGTVVQGLLNAKDAIKTAGLDWKVDRMPITCNGKVLNFPTEDNSSDCWQGIVRQDTGDVLGVMKGRYNVIQNVECFDFMDVLAGEGNIQYETAGALRGGKQVWMMAKYNGGMKINKDDHEQWLLLVTSHDGSYSLMVQWVTVRVVCSNTLSVALRSCKNQMKIRHTKTWEDKASEAKRVLGLTKDYFADLNYALEGLNEQKVGTDEVNMFIRILMPADDEKEVPTRTMNMRNEIVSLFNRPNVGTFGSTRWDLLNATTDYTDHYQGVRGKNKNRMESALLGSGADLKQRAFEILRPDGLLDEVLVGNN